MCYSDETSHFIDRRALTLKIKSLDFLAFSRVFSMNFRFFWLNLLGIKLFCRIGRIFGGSFACHLVLCNTKRACLFRFWQLTSLNENIWWIEYICLSTLYYSLLSCHDELYDSHSHVYLLSTSSIRWLCKTLFMVEEISYSNSAGQ